jgi:hypothetical protein
MAIVFRLGDDGSFVAGDTGSGKSKPTRRKKPSKEPRRATSTNTRPGASKSSIGISVPKIPTAMSEGDITHAQARPSLALQARMRPEGKPASRLRPSRDGRTLRETRQRCVSGVGESAIGRVE